MEEGGCKAVFTACCNAEVQSNSKEYIHTLHIQAEICYYFGRQIYLSHNYIQCIVCYFHFMNVHISRLHTLCGIELHAMARLCIGW